MEKGPDGTSMLVVKSSNKLRSLIVAVRIMTKLMTFITLVAFVLTHFRYGFSFHKTQTTQAAALPTRFFPASSAVLDFPFGQLQPVIQLLQDEELIFLMYYAPWCAESISIRNEFMKAAKAFQPTVKFVAVNCWYIDGECRKSMKIFQFPDLYVYHIGIDDGYRFTGPKKAELFVRFVESFLHPIQPLHSEQQIQEFIARQDNTVIGYFDFNSSPQPPGNAFYQFYLAALRVMSYDFYQPIRFGVILVKHLAEFFDMKSPERFILARTGNTTLKYPLFYNMTSKNITNWIFHFRQQNAAQWLVPPGIKSLTLSLALQQGPAVIVLAPSNPLFDFNPYFDMVNLASLQYNRCGNYTVQIENIMRHTAIRSLLQLGKLRQLTKKCHSTSTSCTKAELFKSKCCVSFLTGARTSSSVCEYCVQKSYLDSDTVCDIEWNSLKRSEIYSANVNSCIHSYQNYNRNEHYFVNCNTGQSSASKNAILNGGERKLRRPTDPYVIYGAHSALRLQCSKFSLQKQNRLVQHENLTNIVTKRSDFFDSGLLLGEACVTNKTVRYFFMDSSYHSLFVEKLGIPVRTNPNRASVILVDLKNEATYQLREKVNYANLVKFVTNYTEGLLDRHRLSSESSSPSECDPASTSFCVIDVSKETFSSVVLDSDKDVVLLYQTPWCGFCSHFAHTFLAAAKYFSSFRNITFARINGDVNDLPWEFIVDKYPTVILFPAHRKADSVKFPDNVRKSLPNIIKFVLYHSAYQLQLDSAVTICSKDCVELNKRLASDKINQLNKLLSQLQRKLLTLTGHTNTEHAVRALVRQVYELRIEKLNKVQQLHYFLGTDIKQLSKMKL